MKTNWPPSEFREWLWGLTKALDQFFESFV